MPTFIVISFASGEKTGQARLIDGIDAKYAATQGLEDHDVYVVPEDKARLFRDQPRSRDEVPASERSPAT